MSNKIRLAAITDSPKITTGFGNVANQLLRYFHNNGIDVKSLGTMDSEMDLDGVIPFDFLPANVLDKDTGEFNFNRMVQMFSLFLVNARPDVIFLLYDPGTLSTYFEIIKKLRELNLVKKVPVVLYTPIEGFPIPDSTAKFFDEILKDGGRVILYSPGTVEMLTKQFPQFQNKVDYALHGLDHANFRKYDKEHRKEIRKLAGLDDYFVVGSIGVNKRTKGFDNIIYTARCLKDLNEHHNIKFYLHTSKNKPVMLGYNLEEMSKNYDVEDMIIFKPEQEEEAYLYVNGIKRDSDDVDVKSLSDLSFIDRLNMLDCYLDLSQVEGWGLPAHEAMRCGVPAVTVNDMAIRSEIHANGAIILDTLPFRTWTTWHNGVKLAQVDPLVAANSILELKNSSDEIKEYWSKVALRATQNYNWDVTGEKILNIIKETV